HRQREVRRRERVEWALAGDDRRPLELLARTSELLARAAHDDRQPMRIDLPHEQASSSRRANTKRSLGNTASKTAVLDRRCDLRGAARVAHVRSWRLAQSWTPD